ncbi:hypothetical protein XELAEV_18036464mg [Xenopus laevis]|uniref:Uncharacterized protein n=1 Tax=Xenopus laevis TaxID=8355 RepID=A0A974HD24_XENLA|nr:hypothetical protein XELAEV_18036464mg [Xenopus laevis]
MFVNGISGKDPLVWRCGQTNGSLHLWPPLGTVPAELCLGDGVNGNIQNIYNMPLPLAGPVSESGEPVNLRIPSPLPNEEEPLNLNTPPELTPSMSNLIYKNMHRWKKIRQRWKDASYRNQQRYAQSMKILKEMYERQ